MMANRPGRRRVLIAAGSSCYPKPLAYRQTLYSEAPPDPLMPDQEQLDDFLEALEKAGSPARNEVGAFYWTALALNSGLWVRRLLNSFGEGCANGGSPRSGAVPRLRG
jgi:hypothetical protein